MKRSLITAFVLITLIFCTAASADNLVAIEYYNRGVDLAYEGNHPEALASINRALEENSNFTLALATKAGILNELGQYREAIDVAERALALDPGEAAAWNNKAFALNQLGRYEEALNAADAAVSLDPDMAEGWVNKGSSLIGIGSYEEALAASEEALSRDPTSSQAAQNRDIATRFLSPTPTVAAVEGWVLIPVAILAGILLKLTGTRKRK
ncbi:MAG: tetratricopeptide repeat protein [Methanoregulaceae archaeon]